MRRAGDAATTCLPDWSVAAILRGKRRCDVVGQYGQDGFMLLMVQTPKPGGVACCRRLQLHLEHPEHERPGPRTPVHSFFGVASLAGASSGPQKLLRIAEQNLELAHGHAASSVVAD